MCLKPGQTKNTYRGGCFLLCNTGEEKVMSTHGLVTTVAYKLGKDTPTVYALEGNGVFVILNNFLLTNEFTILIKDRWQWLAQR